MATSPGAGAVTHPRLAGRRNRGRACWWAKAWTRAVEEAAYGEADLRAGRALARGGRVGRITVDTGGFVAAVEEGPDPERDEVRTVSGGVPVLDEGAVQALVETVAAESGRLAALLAGDLPHSLVEHAEEAGVELLPFGGELTTECTCTAWIDPCPHGLAALTQLGWLLESDPFVLLHLRGLTRDDLLARLHARVRGAVPDHAADGADPDAPDDPDDPDGDGPEGAETGAAPGGEAGAGDAPELVADLETALDAALRAARVLELLEGDHPEAPLDHLL